MTSVAPKDWLDYVSAIGAVLTPLLVLGLTAVGWRLKHALERRKELEDKLRADRIETYNEILEPFIILFTTDAAWSRDKQNRNRDKNEVAVGKLLSFEYRKHSFRLSLIGSDDVVRAFNNLFQFFYSQPREQSEGLPADRLHDGLSLLGTFLLEIRRSMGNEQTDLTNWEMLEWFLKDARRLARGAPTD